jgi:hypothetical protein
VVTEPCNLIPRPVLGGHHFTTISAGLQHTCAIDTIGDAYCWGDNTFGAVGTGGTGASVSAPVPVVGGHHFTSIAAGNQYTCGVVLEPVVRGNTAVYCWGSNSFGGLGTGGGSTGTPTKVRFQF